MQDILGKILEPENFKTILTVIIIPLILNVLGNMSVKSQRSVYCHDNNYYDEAKLWLNYFMPLLALLAIEIFSYYIHQKIEGKFLIRIFSYILCLAVIFITEFKIVDCICSIKKNKRELCIHLICLIDSILGIFNVEQKNWNNILDMIYIFLIMVVLILQIFLIIENVKSKYKHLKEDIEIKFEDNTEETKVLYYEERKNSVKVFKKLASGEIEIKTIYGVKIKQKIEKYY